MPIARLVAPMVGTLKLGPATVISEDSGFLTNGMVDVPTSKTDEPNEMAVPEIVTAGLCELRSEVPTATSVAPTVGTSMVWPTTATRKGLGSGTEELVPANGIVDVPTSKAPETREITVPEMVSAGLCGLRIPFPNTTLVAPTPGRSTVCPNVVMREGPGFETEKPEVPLTDNVVDVPIRIAFDPGGSRMSVVAVAESFEIGARVPMMAPLDVMTLVVCNPELILGESGVISDDALPGPLEDFCGRSEGSNHGLLSNPDASDGVKGSLLVGEIAEIELIEVAFGMKGSSVRPVDFGIEGGITPAIARVVLLREASVAVVLGSMSAVTEVRARGGS